MTRRERLLRDLAGLATKYRELALLRARRDEVQATGAMAFDAGEHDARREAFGRVARAFPGALRELERSSADVLRGRARAVEIELSVVAVDPSREAPGTRWIAVTIDYHALMRDALALKLFMARRLGREGTLTDDVVEDLLVFHERRHDAETWRTQTPGRDFYALLRNPPKGRLHPIVWRELGERHGGTPDELVILIFGPPRDPHGPHR